MACGVLNFLTKREWKPADFLPVAATASAKPKEEMDASTIMKSLMQAFPPPPGYLEMVEKRRQAAEGIQ